MKRTPTRPAQSDHRLMCSLLQHVAEGVDPTPQTLDQVARVFVRAGGSWQRLWEGSIDDITLLKKTLRVAAKKGIFPKSPDWE